VPVVPPLPLHDHFASLTRLFDERGFLAFTAHRQPGCEWLVDDARYRALLGQYGYGWVLDQ